MSYYKILSNGLTTFTLIPEEHKSVQINSVSSHRICVVKYHRQRLFFSEKMTPETVSSNDIQVFAIKNASEDLPVDKLKNLTNNSKPNLKRSSATLLRKILLG